MLRSRERAFSPPTAVPVISSCRRSQKPALAGAGQDPGKPCKNSGPDQKSKEEHQSRGSPRSYQTCRITGRRVREVPSDSNRLRTYSLMLPDKE